MSQYPPTGGYPPPGPGQPYPPPGQPYPPPGQPYPPPGGYPPPGAVTAQPGADAWMMKPTIPSMSCPPGLEYLTQIDQLLVCQTVELLEAFVGIECQNKFKINNSMGQQVYYAAEESGFCTRQCCGPHRGFTMHVCDNLGQEVIRAQREFKCCAGCPWCACLNCCAYEIVVEAPVGTVCGYVRQSCSVIKPVFEVLNEHQESVLKLEGPFCICQCPCCDVDFELETPDGQVVGKVSKQWSGFIKEIFTEADNFGINFPMDLDVKVKATLVGAVFLINMMFFENNQQRNDNS